MTNTDLNELKSDPAVLQVYGQYTRLRGIGAGKYQGVCPLHSEKTGSFTVFPDMRWTCYGACGSSGNIYQLVQQMDGVTFEEAVKKVQQVVGSKADWNRQKDRVDQVFKPVAEPKTYKTIPLSDYRKLEDALAQSKAAQAWLLKERGVTYDTACKLRLGFIQSIGRLAGPDGADIADKGWVAFPCIEGEKVVSIKYRSIVRKKPGGFARQPGMATAMFNAQAISPFDPVYLVEGELDAACLTQAGYVAVSVPSAGVKLSPAQKDQLMTAQAVFLAGDSDQTGSGYMDKLWRELGANTYRLTWPTGIKDANEAYLKDPEGFVQLMDDLTRKAKSQPMPDVYSLQEAMLAGKDKTLAEHPDKLRFPWTEVDQMANLLPGSVLGVMATQTGQGKSSFVTQFTLHDARKYNETVVAWHCELSPAELAVIAVAQVLRKNRNFLTPEDMKQAAGMLDGVQYYIGHDQNLSDIMAVLDLMEAAIKRLGATIAVLDNLHFYTTGIDDENRVQAAAMRRIKQIATTTGSKFIVVFQPRKAQQTAKGKKTHITDVKGSASAGDTCDSVMAIHRELAKNREEGGLSDIYEERTLVEMLKTRSKGIGKASCYLHWFGEFASFESLDTHHEEAPE